MKYFFPIHLDGGNRGCEAIAKGSALLISEDKENLFGYCRDVKLDTHLGVDKFFSLIPAKRDSYVIDRCLGLLNKIFHSKKTKAWRELYPYRSFLRLIHSDDVMISTWSPPFRGCDSGTRRWFTFAPMQWVPKNV